MFECLQWPWLMVTHGHAGDKFTFFSILDKFDLKAKIGINRPDIFRF